MPPEQVRAALETLLAGVDDDIADAQLHATAANIHAVMQAAGSLQMVPAFVQRMANRRNLTDEEWWRYVGYVRMWRTELRLLIAGQSPAAARHIAEGSYAEALFPLSVPR